MTVSRASVDGRHRPICAYHLPAIPTSHTGATAAWLASTCVRHSGRPWQILHSVGWTLLRTRRRNPTGEGKRAVRPWAFHLTGCIWHIGIDSCCPCHVGRQPCHVQSRAQHQSQNMGPKSSLHVIAYPNADCSPDHKKLVWTNRH